MHLPSNAEAIPGSRNKAPRKSSAYHQALQRRHALQILTIKPQFVERVQALLLATIQQEHQATPRNISIIAFGHGQDTKGALRFIPRQR